MHMYMCTCTLEWSPVSFLRAGLHMHICICTYMQASFDHLASWIKDVDLYSGEEVIHAHAHAYT